MLQGMGRGPYASCFAGTKASMRFLVDALAWCHTNGRLPSACLLHTLKMYMSNLTSGRRDKVVGYFVEQHGCLIMAELMMLGASKKYKKQHKKPNSPANQLKAECEEMIRVVSESCQGKYVRKLLMKEAQHHLIEEDDQFHYLDPTTIPTCSCHWKVHHALHFHHLAGFCSHRTLGPRAHIDHPTSEL